MKKKKPTPMVAVAHILQQYHNDQHNRTYWVVVRRLKILWWKYDTYLCNEFYGSNFDYDNSWYWNTEFANAIEFSTPEKAQKMLDEKLACESAEAERVKHHKAVNTVVEETTVDEIPARLI